MFSPLRMTQKNKATSERSGFVLSVLLLPAFDLEACVFGLVKLGIHHSE